MSRLIPQGDMAAAEIVRCVVEARALVGLCARAAWSDLQNASNGENVPQISEDIQVALELAHELLDPVQDADYSPRSRPSVRRQGIG